MEEAEALASKAVILSTRMFATGSLSSLQESHGGAYKIRALCSPDVGRSVAERVAQETFREIDHEIMNYWDSRGLVQFNILYDRRALG
jgi:hypothetical protein